MIPAAMQSLRNTGAVVSNWIAASLIVQVVQFADSHARRAAAARRMLRVDAVLPARGLLISATTRHAASQLEHVVPLRPSPIRTSPRL